MNHVALVGHLGSTPSIRYTANTGTAVLNFRMATNKETVNKTTGEVTQQTTWLTVVAWHRLAEACAKALKKGSKVLVDGRLETREYTDREGVKHTVTEVRAKNVNFLDRPGNKMAETHSNDVAEDEGVELQAA